MQYINFNGQDIKIPLRVKIYLGIIFCLGLLFLFLFGFAFLIFSLVVGIVIFFVRLFDRKPSGRKTMNIDQSQVEVRVYRNEPAKPSKKDDIIDI